MTREEATALQLPFPIHKGLITNLDQIESLWSHLLHLDLRIDPAEHPILLTEPALPPPPLRAKSAELLFERFHAPALYLSSQATLSMYASGKIYPSVVVDIGEEVSSVVPLYNEHVLEGGVVQLEVSGGDLTEFLMGVLNAQGYVFGSSWERLLAREMKESLGCVALDHAEALRGAPAQDYCLPDGQVVRVGGEGLHCAEALFQPSLVGRSCFGVHEGIHEAINRCDVDIRRELYGKIILVGGSTLFKGFSDRLSKELFALAPCGMRLHICAAPERRYSSWIGGSILGSLSTFQSMFITQEEYDEIGPVIVNRRCY
uniref:Actin n=1 Tax=Arcella intermedia TaxID=1963864 RepID=A0A6B2L971_9EUKA